MKASKKLFGILITISGLSFIVFHIWTITSLNSDTATITGFLERQSGVNYVERNKGSIYPCKLKVILDSNKKELITFGEIQPCTPYRIGEKIKVRTDGNIVQVSSFSMKLIIPLIIIGVGIIILFIPNELLSTKLKSFKKNTKNHN